MPGVVFRLPCAVGGGAGDDIWCNSSVSEHPAVALSVLRALRMDSSVLTESSETLCVKGVG